MKKLLKEAIKNALDAFGLEIHTRYGSEEARLIPRRTLAEVLDHVLSLGLKPRTVIDIGAAYGTFELYERFPDAVLLLVEAVIEWEEVLKEISRKYKAEYVIAAASDEPGRIVINVHPVLFDSSILKESEGIHVDGIPREVPAVTIDDLCSERNLGGPYLIHADVQGAELKVLNGGRKVLSDTDLVILEVRLLTGLVDAPQFYDVVTYMKEHGFVIYDIFGGINRPLDGALAQVDVAFVKDAGPFRKHQFYATPEQRRQLTKRYAYTNP